MGSVVAEVIVSPDIDALSINVEVAFPDFTLAVDERLPLTGVTGLFGPSGSGKSTLLRIVAGLERAATGTISFGEQSWLDSDSSRCLPAWQRPVGYVFQDPRLFAHLSVEGNLNFANNRSEVQGSKIGWDDVVQVLDLAPLLHRDVAALSGGEKQRVAIGRTLLARPSLLLLDEPLAALDRTRKREILPYLDALTRHFRIPAIYVSHAVEEVARLADKLLIMRDGRIEAFGDAALLLNELEPDSDAAQGGRVTVMNVRVIEQLPGLKLTRVDVGGQTMTVPAVAGLQPGEPTRIYVRAGDVAIAIAPPAGLSIRNVLTGTVLEIDGDEQSAFANVSVNIGSVALHARLTREAVAVLRLQKGSPVYALVKVASFDRLA